MLISEQVVNAGKYCACAHDNKKKDLLTLIVPIVVAFLGLAKVSSLPGPVVA
jgi:hypothetical protein